MASFRNVEAVTFPAISGQANMNLPVQEALERLSASPPYVRRFQTAFGPGPITQERVEQALATYERGIVSSPAPFDRWVDGDEAAVGAAAKRGFAMFDGKAGCSGCHSGWAFTDYSFQDIGSATAGDIGRGALFPSSVSLRYAFKRVCEKGQAAASRWSMRRIAATSIMVSEVCTRYS